MTDPRISIGPNIGERVRGTIWLAPIFLAAAELVGFVTMRSRVASDDDFRRAGAYIASELRATDQVRVAPDWTKPRVLEHVGERLGVRRAADLDLAAYDRLFLVSVGGRSLPGFDHRAPIRTRRFGEVSVSLFDLGHRTVLYDFFDHLHEARVERVRGGVASPCPWVRVPARGGGLGQGPYWPSERFVCDPQTPWLFVGRTVSEDLDLSLRACIWHHPQGPEPIRATFPNVPLGERLVVDADIYYEHERNEVHEQVPFELRVLVDGRDAGGMRHVDGDGRKRMTIVTAESGRDPNHRGEVTFEVTTATPHLRTVCWTASTRTAARENGR